jgi:DNA-binding beta-propeller fold protein YncE
VAAVVVTAACGSPKPGIPIPLPTAPEPALSPPAKAVLPGSVITFGGEPEGIAIDAAGEVAVDVRSPDGVVLFAIDKPSDRRTMATGGSARHLDLAGPNGPLLVADETDNTFVEFALPGGHLEQSVRVGDHPHEAVEVGPSRVFVGDEFSNTIHIIEDGRVPRVVPAPLQPGGLAADAPGTHALAVGVRGRRISEYTASGDLVGTANCGAGPTHVVAGDDGLFWVADTNGGDVLAFDLGPHGPAQVATIPVGSHPYGLAFDTQRDTLWVTITGADQLLGLHLKGSKVASRTTYDTVRQPNTVAVDEVTGQLVVTGSTQPGQLQFFPEPGS